jgi:hypothetical protein
MLPGETRGGPVDQLSTPWWDTALPIAPRATAWQAGLAAPQPGTPYWPPVEGNCLGCPWTGTAITVTPPVALAGLPTL